MKRSTQLRFVFGALLLVPLLLSPARAKNLAATLHPKAQPLPFTHQGPFVTTGDGGVLCVDAENALSSRDEGRTWTAIPIFRDENKYRISNERALLRTRDGVVLAAWMNLRQQKSPAGWKWGAKEADWRDFVLPIYVCRSLDDGKTWQEPVFLNKPWCGCIHSMIETGSGRIVLVGQEVIPAWRHATVVFLSDDKGVTWRRSNVLDIGQGRHDHAGSIEGAVVERKDGSLYQLLRTETGWLYEAASRNGGLLWEDLKQSRLKSVTCCAQMARLADGRIALLWNHPPRHRPDSGSSREELSIAFSSDECGTWSPPKVVAGSYGPGGRVSYPYLYERKPGELWITTMQGGLRMKIDVADLDRGEIPIYTPPVAPPPKPGGIVMFGDSTTAERRGAVEKVYAERVQESLQGIGSSLTVHNAGVGSNTTQNARDRFARDVAAHKPRVVVIQFGINDAAVDVWKTPPATASRVPLSEYEQNLRWIIAQLRHEKAKPVLMTTNPTRWTARLREIYGKPPYRPDAADGFDAPVLARYNDVVRRLAKELAVPLVDVHAAFTAKDVDKLLLDGMHPNDAGQQLIAELLVPILREQVRPEAQAGQPANSDLKRFLPNDGNCVYGVTGLLRRWPAGGPKKLWQVEIGWGKSAVVEAGGRAFTAAEVDGKQWALGLDPATGATLWKHLLLPQENRHYERGPVTSPVVDDDRVYFIPYAIFEKDVWEMRCPIVCLKADGTELWRVDKDFWATEGSTPLVVGDTLYVGADNPERVVLVALDKMTGRLRWAATAKSDAKRELGAPASLTYQVVDGVPQVIVATYGTKEVLGVHARTGQLMWRYPYPAGIIIGLVSTPVAVGSRLFVCAGEGKNRDFSVCLQMQAVGGKITCRELYQSDELQVNTYHTVSVYQDAVFGFGGRQKTGFLHCTNLADGRLLWKVDKDEWTKEQQLVIADGLIFALTKKDELVLAEASRAGYKELGRTPVGMELGRQQQPTIANGRLYLRGNQAVACYRIVP